MWKKFVNVLKWTGVAIGSMIFALALLVGYSMLLAAVDNHAEKSKTAEYKEGYVQAIHDVKTNKVKTESLPSAASYLYKETLDGKVLTDTITVR